MKYRTHKLLATPILASLLLAVLLASNGQAAVGQKSQALSLETRIVLPNVQGRIDHFSVDVPGQRLFMAAVDNHTLEVIDLKSGKRIHTIADLAEPQGVFYNSATNLLYVACGGDGRTNIYDGSTFKLVASWKFPADADNIRYDARDRLVVVGYAGGKHVFGMHEEGTGALGFLDARGKLIKEIEIDAHPESFQLENPGTRIFVNVPDKQEIEVIDLAKNAAVARWPVKTARDNFPMALDDAHHRLIVGAWAPPGVLVFDIGTGRQVASVAISGKTDDLFYDASKARIYVLADAGALYVIQQDDADHYHRIAQYATPQGSETGLFVPGWGKLFAGVWGRKNQPAEILVYQTR